MCVCLILEASRLLLMKSHGLEWSRGWSHRTIESSAEESMEEALECEAKSTAPSKEMRKRMGDLGLSDAS